MKILIAGFGSIGRRHFRNLLSLGIEDILFYRTHQSTIPDGELKGFIVENDLSKALAHSPDAVIVANPTASHMDVALQAAQAGCHLLLEKPISHNLVLVEELRQALEKNHKTALIGYQFRFHPVLRQVKQQLEAGSIGRPLSFRVEWGEYLPAWHPWEDYRKSYSARDDLGGGVVLTLSHPLDYLHWFFDKVDWLWAVVDKLSDLEVDVDDFAEIVMRFENGVTGSLNVNYFQRPPVHRFEIVGTKGTIKWDNGTGEAQLYNPDKKHWQLFSPPAGFDRNDLFLAEMEHFIAVINGNTEPLCSFEDGVAALSLALAALDSSKYRKLVKV